MKSIFLADAHLKYPTDENYRRLNSFLQNLPEDIENLFILGDFFDFWFGYRKVVFSVYVPILATLEALVQRGIKLYFIEGNHEISLGPFFRTHLHAHSNPSELSVYLSGQRLYLAHGDLLDDSQQWYRRWVGFIKSPFICRLISLIPPDFTCRIAQWLSKISRNQSQNASHIPEKLTNKLADIFRAGHDVAIIAHYHHPAQNQVVLNDQKYPVYHLGDWITDYSYLVLEDGNFQLKKATSQLPTS
jgi:UDP-2,3-diacylglucosamine hydrolase